MKQEQTATCQQTTPQPGVAAQLKRDGVEVGLASLAAEAKGKRGHLFTFATEKQAKQVFQRATPAPPGMPKNVDGSKSIKPVWIINKQFQIYGQVLVDAESGEIYLEEVADCEGL